MSEAILKLLEVSTPSIGGNFDGAKFEKAVVEDNLKRSLSDLLMGRNGFLSFDSALRVFPCSEVPTATDIITWNEENCWRGRYNYPLEGMTFFAEDAFGCQFALFQGTVVSFDPETAATNFIANSLDEWANLLLEDFPVLTGHPLVNEWQLRNGPLQADYHLVPKIPFVMGGDYSAANCYAMPSIQSMHYRANIANQIKNLKDGQKVRLVIQDV